MPFPAPIPRPFWLQRIRAAWKSAPIAWLSGVRRAGKSTIAEEFEDALHLNCDLPSVQRLALDPEALYASVRKRVVVFDEVHRLADPSLVLKIGADTRKDLRILATGSSTLEAMRTFRDSLAGRKRQVTLQPVLFQELPAFGNASIDRRLLHGGLPQMLLADRPDPAFYSEWLDSYYARDIVDLFRVEKRREFLLLVRLMLRQNGGMMTATALAKEAGASRPTIQAWIEAMRITHLLHVVPPFHGGGHGEILKQPKAYAFDTGFVAHENGWTELRPDERGRLWENVVLEHLLSRGPSRPIHFWRDAGNEVDFVLPGSRGSVDAVECKMDPGHFNPKSLRRFRESYPRGSNWLVCPSVPHAHDISAQGLKVHVTEPTGISVA